MHEYARQEREATQLQMDVGELQAERTFAYMKETERKKPMGWTPQKFGEWLGIMLMIWLFLLIVLVGTVKVMQWAVG